MTEPRDHQLTIRIPLRIRRALERDATAERRTVADVVNLMLEERYPSGRRPYKPRRPRGEDRVVVLGREVRGSRDVTETSPLAVDVPART